MLERSLHAENCFVTLTYRDRPDGELPFYSGRSLQRDHLSGWVKRFRERVRPRTIRFFACGEYGSKTLRPHYHAAVFGFPCCVGFGGRKLPGGGSICECFSCRTVRDSWGFGHTMVGSLDQPSAQYIAGYVTKKARVVVSPGMEPPFARMSLRPGLGAGVVPSVASSIERYSLRWNGDVPVTLVHGSTAWPLGRYLRGKVREELGLDKKCPPEALAALQAKLQPVFDAAALDAPSNGDVRRLLVKNAISDENAQLELNVSRWERIAGGTL